VPTLEISKNEISSALGEKAYQLRGALCDAVNTILAYFGAKCWRIFGHFSRDG